MKDVMGSDLDVGDLVLFATKFGQTAWLKLSIICDIKEKEDYGGRRHKTASIMSADLYGTNGGPAKISSWRTEDKGYPKLGHNADPQKMFKIGNYRYTRGQHEEIVRPLVEAYEKYLKDKNETK